MGHAIYIIIIICNIMVPKKVGYILSLIIIYNIIIIILVILYIAT